MLDRSKLKEAVECYKFNHLKVASTLVDLAEQYLDGKLIEVPKDVGAGKCVCGDPDDKTVTHRQDKPCYVTGTQATGGK